MNLTTPFRFDAATVAAMLTLALLVTVVGLLLWRRSIPSQVQLRAAKLAFSVLLSVAASFVTGRITATGTISGLRFSAEGGFVVFVCALMALGLLRVPRSLRGSGRHRVSGFWAFSGKDRRTGDTLRGALLIEKTLWGRCVRSGKAVYADSASGRVTAKSMWKGTVIRLPGGGMRVWYTMWYFPLLAIAGPACEYSGMIETCEVADGHHEGKFMDFGGHCRRCGDIEMVRCPAPDLQRALDWGMNHFEGRDLAAGRSIRALEGGTDSA